MRDGLMLPLQSLLSFASLCAATRSVSLSAAAAAAASSSSSSDSPCSSYTAPSSFRSSASAPWHTASTLRGALGRKGRNRRLRWNALLIRTHHDTVHANRTR